MFLSQQTVIGQVLNSTIHSGDSFGSGPCLDHHMECSTKLFCSSLILFKSYAMSKSQSIVYSKVAVP